jgi:hypothetical protein
MTFTPETARAAQKLGIAAKHRNRDKTTSPKQVDKPAAAPKFDWWHSPLQECEDALISLRDQWQKANEIVSTRQAQVPRKKWFCHVCGKEMEDGQWKFKDDSRRDPQTGLVSPAVVCSITCYTKYWAERPRLGPRK